MTLNLDGQWVTLIPTFVVGLVLLAGLAIMRIGERMRRS
jgi:hypothetical protein